MLERSGCNELVVDETGLTSLKDVLTDIVHPLVVVAPFVDDVTEFRKQWPKHTVVGKHDLCSLAGWTPEECAGDDLAYMMFTSGSTGTPKAVGVTHRNIRAFLDTVVERYHVTSDDRFSQTFALNFDLAVFDLFAAWECGACVCIPTKEQMLNIGRYIDSERLSVWFSTPSTAIMIKRLGQLEPEQHPGLRLSLFCGEALPVEIAQAWAASAPNSITENLYGPTELTLCCTYYRWDDERTALEAENGVVPIGEPFPGMTVLVANETLVEVAPGTVGELLMTGPQLTLGYWRDADKTKAAFVVPPGKDCVYYRTGDRVRHPLPERPLTYLGRQDNQIQIHGIRVELGEIEAALREEAKVAIAVAMGWPAATASAAGVVAFIEPTEIELGNLKKLLAKRLPSTMLPRRIEVLDKFPTNPNGKIDRKVLKTMLPTT